MKFYDSVKSSVREEAQDESGSADDTDQEEEGDEEMPFDQLKKDARTTQTPEENQEDSAGSQHQEETHGTQSAGSDIEVLSSDEDTGATDSRNQQASTQTGEPSETVNAPEQGDGETVEQADMKAEDTVAAPAAQDSTVQEQQNVAGPQVEELVSALHRIEQQNDEMLNVLRGIKRSLER